MEHSPLKDEAIETLGAMTDSEGSDTNEDPKRRKRDRSSYAKDNKGDAESDGRRASRSDGGARKQQGNGRAKAGPRKSANGGPAPSVPKKPIAERDTSCNVVEDERGKSYQAQEIMETHTAADGSQWCVVKTLTKGVNVVCPRASLKPGLLLLDAASTGELDDVKRLWNEDVARCADNSMNTPLHLAAYNGHLAMCQFIVENDGRDQLEAKNKNLQTPLHVAIMHPEVFEYLLRQPETDALAEDLQGRTVLARAADQNEVAALKICKARGMDVNMATGPDKRTPLHLAAKSNGYGAVQELLTFPGIQPLARDEMGQTALHMAAANGHQPIVDLLVGVAPQAAAVRDKTGKFPADLAKAGILKSSLLELSEKHAGTVVEEPPPPPASSSPSPSPPPPARQPKESKAAAPRASGGRASGSSGAPPKKAREPKAPEPKAESQRESGGPSASPPAPPSAFALSAMAPPPRLTRSSTASFGEGASSASGSSGGGGGAQPSRADAAAIAAALAEDAMDEEVEEEEPPVWKEFSLRRWGARRGVALLYKRELTMAGLLKFASGKFDVPVVEIWNRHGDVVDSIETVERGTGDLYYAATAADVAAAEAVPGWTGAAAAAASADPSPAPAPMAAAEGGEGPEGGSEAEGDEPAPMDAEPPAP